MAKPRASSKRVNGFQSRVSHKIEENMRELNAGTLHSGSKSGPLVKNRKQAIAISYSQARKGMG